MLRLESLKFRSKYKVRESNYSFESGCNFQKKDQIDLIGIFKDDLKERQGDLNVGQRKGVRVGRLVNGDEVGDVGPAVLFLVGLLRLLVLDLLVHSMQ